MKKTSVILALFLFFSTVSPQILFAADMDVEMIEVDNEELRNEELDYEFDAQIESVEVESEDSIEIESNDDIELLEDENIEERTNLNVKVEYNDLGVRKGTLVYGEDISELSEWELQYIPEGWRDGIVESEHHIDSENSEPMMRLFQSYPNVNNYIQSQNFKAAKITYDYKDFFTKFNYRNGFGMVEGIVAHETANNSSTISSEIAYMSRNHKNAFVHAFVDHSQIIEIHPPELGAWGAGRYANQRFIHIELVRVHNFDDFARSINNYSEYVAHLLYKYNLGVTDADKNGNGTLWSHRAVSQFLGGTTHVDPHGYFERWGYNWNDFVSLVKRKYDALVASKKQYTSKLGHIKSSDVQIYEDPMNLKKYQVAGSHFTHEVYYIKQEAVVNGKTYYLMSRQPSNRNGVVGWIEKSNVSAYEHYGISNHSEQFIIRGSGKSYNKAWGGRKNIVFENLALYDGHVFKVNLIEKVGDSLWYRGMLNGKQAWVHQDNVSKESNTSRLGHIRNANVKIYPRLNDNTGAVTAGQDYTHAVYYIKKQAEINGNLFYLISKNPSSINGVVGWVKAVDLSSYPHLVVNKGNQVFYLTGAGSSYTKAWGGSKDLVYRDLSEYKYDEFNVHLIESVGNDIWYRGTLNGKTMWVHSDYMAKKEEKRISRLGHIRNANVKIYEELGKESSVIIAGTNYTHQVYYIKSQVSVDGQLFYLISKNPSSTNGVVGWVNEKDLSTHPHTVVDKKAKTFYLKGIGIAYNKAWGGSKDIVYANLSTYENLEFKVHLTESVGGNVWYRGVLNNKTVWIHSSNISTKEESRTSRLGHIRSAAVKIYEQLGRESSSFSAGAEYTNHVYYIKKQASINGKLYYLISKNPSSENGVVGWVKSEDLSSYSHLVTDKHKKNLYFKGTGSAYSKAWGGSKDLTIKDLTSLENKEFKVHLTETVGDIVWYRGKINGKTVWVHSDHLFVGTEKRTSRLGHLRSKNVKIYRNLHSDASFMAGDNYTHAVYYIKQEALIKNQLYYQISTSPSSVNGVIGWVKSEDLSSHPHVGVDKVNKKFIIRGNGSAYSKAWGGSKDLVYKDLSSFKNQEFKVHLTERVGNNIWYRGTLNGKTVWIHPSYLK